MTTILVQPPADGSHNSLTVNGRVYTATPGTPISVPDFVGSTLIANGWTQVPRSGSFVRKSGPLRVIPFGDSVTQGSSSQNANGLWSQSAGYADMALQQAGSRFQWIRNAGVAGDTSAQILARVGTDVLAYSPDVVLLMAGTNDILTGMGSSGIASMMNNIEQTIIELLQARVEVVLVSPPPKTTGQSGHAESRQVQQYFYMLANYYGLRFFDAYRVLVNPSTGDYITGYSGDGIHPNQAGIQALSTALGAAMQSFDSMHAGPYLAAVGETSQGQVSNMIANGNFSHVTTPPTPDTWTVNTTNATPTEVTPALPLTGNAFHYVKTDNAGAYALFGANVTGGYSPGDVLVFAGRVKTSGLATSAAGMTVGLDTVSAGSARPINAVGLNGEFYFAQELTVPASGASALTPTAYVQDAGTYEFANLTLWNLTAAQATWSPGKQSLIAV